MQSILSLILLLLLSLPLFSFTNEIKVTSDTLETKIDQLMSEWDSQESPGAAIGVIKDGKLIFAKGYGSANLEYNIPITPSSIFHMASVSKQFTAFAAAMLAEQGKISLDDDIRKYFPEMPDYGKTITVRNLIYHTSGIRDQWELTIMSGKRMQDVITKNDILRLVMHQKELNFNPGEEHLYCNSGYTLLAEIVSRVTGKTFNEWTKENIFIPLGMNDTFFYEDNELVVKNRVYSYRPFGAGFKKANLNYSNSGATSLFTNINDLVKWVNNFYDPVVGSPALINQLETRGILNNGDTINYAFGQVITNIYGSRMIVHNGGDAGYRTVLMRFPEKQIAVIVLSNLGSFNMGGMADKIAAIMLGTAKTDPPKTKKKTPADFKVAPEILKEYEGLFELQPDVEITISCKNDSLILKMAGEPDFPLLPISEKEFLFKEFDAQISFVRNEENKVNEFIFNQNGQDMKWRRIVKDKEEINFTAYTGTYYSEELETQYTISVKGQSLNVSNIHMDDIQPVPAGKDKFTFIGHIIFIFERDNQNQVNALRMTSGRVRNVLFKRITPGSSGIGQVIEN